MHAQIEVEDLAVIKGNESNIMAEDTYNQANGGASDATGLTSLNTSNGPQKQQNRGGQGGADQNKMNRNKNKNNKFVKKPPHMQNQQQNGGFNHQNGGNKFNKSKNGNMGGGMMNPHGQQNSQHQFMSHMANVIPAHERKFTGRCRLFVGNLPTEMTEAEFKEMFVKYGEIGEVFINTQRSFGFIKLDTRINAEHARQELDGHTVKGRCLRVRFASHGAAVKVKNLSPHVSNEYLESAFAQFGPVERAVVMVDDKGKPTGEGLVEFERKSSAQQCISRCAEHPFILTHYPRPVVVESYEQVDDEDGLPEKSMTKNPQFYAERETLPRFAKPGSFEFEVAQKWHEFYEQEKQINEEARQKVEQAKEMLEYEIEQRLVDYKANMIKEDLQRKQEELLRLEEMRKGDFQRRKEHMDQFRRQDDDSRRNTSATSNNNNNSMEMKNSMNRGLFDQGALLSQPLQQPILSNVPAAGNRQQQQQQQQLVMQAQQQQQAILAAHLSALAAAAQQQHQQQQQMQYGGGNYDGYDNSGHNNNNNNHHKSKRDDYRDDRQPNRGNQLGGKRNMSNANHGGMRNNNNNNNNQRGGYDGTKRARY